jgi:transcriptional regulator with XRE-family HTH domain
MEEQEIRKWLEEKNYTAYEIEKEVSLSLQGIHNFLKGNRKPQRKTLIKLEEFVIKKMQLYTNNDQINQHVLNEPDPLYKEVSNKEIYDLIESLGISLGNNAKAVSRVLNSTFKNTKEILKVSNEIKWKIIDDASKELSETN